MIHRYSVKACVDCSVLYTCLVEDAIAQFEITRGRPLIVLRDDHTLFGIFSQGDLRRSLLRNKDLLKLRVGDVCNRSPLYASERDTAVTISALLKGSIQAVPIVNKFGQPKYVAFIDNDPTFRIDNIILQKSMRNYLVIAEIGVNHNGSFDTAKTLINQAKLAGAHAVKFQFRSAFTYGDPNITGEDLSTEYIREELSKVSLSEDDEIRLLKYAKSLNLIVVVTPFDEFALSRIDKSIVSCIKIASCDLTNHLLLSRIAEVGLPVILSTGMSFEHEILTALEILKSMRSDLAVLHTNSTYPCPRDDLNLSYITRLHEITNCICGYSSHDGSVEPIYLAIALGAQIYEIHLTLDKNHSGTDHRASLTPSELTAFISNLESLILSVGSSNPRIPSSAELLNRSSLGKSLHYKRNLNKGHLLEEKDLYLASPATGLSWYDKDLVLGKKLTTDVSVRQKLIDSHFLFESTLENLYLTPFNRDKTCNVFNHKWGIPVRYRDFNDITHLFNPPLYEFHMSSKDLDLNPAEFVGESYDAKLFVHAIEQYHDGFILDLASLDENIRARSLQRLSRLCEVSIQLSQFFTNKNAPSVIVNCGGFSFDRFDNHATIIEKESNLLHTLRLIKSSYPSINFLPQTMPPFPWLQGGRSYHNILVSLESILRISEVVEVDICLDLSHTYMACHYLEVDFYSCINSLISSGIVSHVHASDAKDFNQEGLQIGEGDINFTKISPLFYSKSITFIPEVWEGHTKNFSGFVTSMNYLTSIFS